MNICIISQRYPYKDNMEFVFVKKLVDEWVKMGHSCVVITSFSWMTYSRKRIDYKPRHYQDIVADNVVVDVYNPRTITTKIVIGKVAVDDWLASKTIECQIEKLGIKFDFIYCHFFSSAFITYHYAYKHKVPLFVASGESDFPKLYKPFNRFTLEGFRDYTSGVVAVSSKNRNEAAEIGLIDLSKCCVFPNGTDLTIFHPMNRNSCREKLGFPQDAFIISCVGFICERKGQNRLLEAVRMIGDENIKLLFLGKSAVLESFSLEGDEILFNGVVDNGDIPTYLCASDVFCLPTRAEGCCNAVIESLACGLPIISSDLPFNWDVLDERNSILVNPNSIDEIANGINALRNNLELRQKLSDGAKAKAESLDINKRAIKILEFINERI